MTADEITKLLGRAKSVAVKWGYPQCANDFAQEAFIAIANGSHPKLEWLFIDFLRREYGNSRTISGRVRQLAERYGVRLDAPASEEDAAGKLNHDCIGSTEPSPESVLADRPPSIDYGRLQGREREFAVLTFRDEWTMQRIAGAYGVTESRVSQVLSQAKAHLKPYLEYDDLKQRLELGELSDRFTMAGIEL